MTGKDVYERAITSLGYADSQVLKNKALNAINQVYDTLWPIGGALAIRPLKSLGDEINLDERITAGVMVYGVAERLALGEGDGELQQYFGRRFDAARGRINRIDSVDDVIPKPY